MEKLVRRIDDGPIAIVELNRPMAANAIDLELATTFLEVVRDVVADASVGAVVLRSHGRLFCGGGDIRAFSAADDLPGHLRDVATPLHAAIELLVDADCPIVAAVHAPVAGAGLGIAMCADLVVAGRTATFSMGYIGIGLSLDAGTSWLLPRLVGLRRALELTLTNRRLDAQEALAIGLVTEVVDDGDVHRRASELAAHLASGARTGLAAAKRLVWTSDQHSLGHHLALEVNELARSARATDANEGIAAFLEKRSARFRGKANGNATADLNRQHD
jgi:2-(1,2-epoxy-1,2-dihydrophenyl)acetyl-CoA isomerase